MGCACFHRALVSIRANRVDARSVDRENKEMMLIEMTSPWMDNRKQKEEEKTFKHALD